MSVPRAPHIGPCQETFLGARIITVLKQLHLGSKCGHRGHTDTMIPGVYGDTDSDPCIDAEIKSSQARSYCKPSAIVCLQFWNNSTSLLESHLDSSQHGRQEACQNNGQHKDPSQFLIELYDNDSRVRVGYNVQQTVWALISLPSPSLHSAVCVSVWGRLFSLSSACSNHQPPKSLMNQK